LRRSGESFTARALAPNRPASETVTGLFIPQSYHNGICPFLLNSSNRTHRNVERNELAPTYSCTVSSIPRELYRPTRGWKAVFGRSDSLQANVAAAERSSV
jgi:hypothetical protein